MPCSEGTAEASLDGLSSLEFQFREVRVSNWALDFNNILSLHSIFPFSLIFDNETYNIYIHGSYSASRPCYMGGTIQFYGAKDYAEHERRFAKIERRRGLMRRGDRRKSEANGVGR